MPPKEKKSAKKGRKLTKAQREKQQQEEEERRLREEEEALLRAEREEQERLERKRKQKEIERLEIKDQARREDELNELRHLLEENHTAVTAWKRDAVEKAKWERYMRCDGAPDPTAQREISTYISLWRDDPEVSIPQVLKQCNVALQLVEELEDLLKEVTDPLESQRYQEALINLQELIHSKHLQTTEEILKTASANIDTETGNMRTVIKDDKITLCLWANLRKNARFKGLNFEEAGMGFELPKHLAVSDIAVRILHTHYDHLSALARITHLGAPSHRSLAGDEKVLEDVEIPEQEQTKEGGGGVEEEDDVEVRSLPGSEGRKSEASWQPSQGRTSRIHTQVEALFAEGDPISPRTSLTSTGQGEQVVDLMQYTPLGGVFYYDVFRLPPQAHKVNGWEIRQLLDSGLEVFSCPTEKSSPPVGVSVALPDSVIFLEAPQVARWDATGKQWRMDGVTDVSYEEAEAKISFKMESFQPFVLMQETYANLPFQSWELRPLGQDAALYTVNGALINLNITVQGNQCLLQAEQERTGLSHLLGKWMSGPALQRAMLDVGINIFVNEYTDQYVSVCKKDPLTEHATYEQMALSASACAFSWSRWNAKCGAEHLVLQVCEHRGSDPVSEGSWSLYLLGAQRSQRLEITEQSAVFSPDHHPGSEFHSTFIHMLQDDMSPAGAALSRSSHHLFVDTVQSLLCATRPLAYS